MASDDRMRTQEARDAKAAPHAHVPRLVTSADTNGEGVFAIWWVADVTVALPAPAEPSPAASAEASAAAGETYTLAASSAGFLTGEDGKTLYTFGKDTTPNQSACTDKCAENWPPFTVESNETVVAGDGVTGTIATFARADGSMQVSYNGAPLYYFVGDAAAGDATGDGKGGFALAKP